MVCEFHLVTGNDHKVKEASHIVKGYDIRLVGANIEKVELQSDSLEEIAIYAARQAYIRIRKPVLVDDSGLFVESLGGFPGPYSSYAYRKLGVEGLLRLLGDSENRRACFRTALAMIYPPLEAVFVGEVCGHITREPRGSGGFGFDPIFVPEGHTKTFAEMSVEEKNTVSHRARAFRMFAKYATTRLGCANY